MHQSRTSPALFRSLMIPAAALVAVLLLAGCAPEVGPTGPGTEDPDSTTSPGGTTTPPAAGDHLATFTMAGQSFTFSPTMCMITDEDVLVSGPGVDDDSKEPAYFDIDLYDDGSLRAGEARIDLGTDQKFSSSDDFYAANIGSGHEYMIMDDGGTFVLEAAFRASSGEPIGTGEFRIDCG